MNYEYWIRVDVSEQFGMLYKEQIFDSLQMAGCCYLVKCMRLPWVRYVARTDIT
jgi:hypothetical protein